MAGRVVACAIHVTDLDRAVAFYAEALGMHERARYELPGVTEVLMSHGDSPDATAIMLLSDSAHAGQYTLGDGFHRMVMWVDDADEAAKSIRELGGSIETEPHALPEHGVKACVASDPDGYRLEILSAIS
jgi:lactoylglutathione lyase